MLNGRYYALHNLIALLQFTYRFFENIEIHAVRSDNIKSVGSEFDPQGIRTLVQTRRLVLCGYSASTLYQKR